MTQSAESCNGYLFHNYFCILVQIVYITQHQNFTENDDFSEALVILDQMGEPEKPFRVQKGDVQGHIYLIMALVKEIHEQIF